MKNSIRSSIVTGIRTAQAEITERRLGPGPQDHEREQCHDGAMAAPLDTVRWPLRTKRLGLAVLASGLVGSGVDSAVFLWLAVMTRNAVVVGLIYALVWESLVGQVVPGAQAQSIQQWGYAVTEGVVGDDALLLGIGSAVDLSTAAVLLVVVIVGCTWYATRRLRTIRLGE